MCRIIFIIVTSWMKCLKAGCSSCFPYCLFFQEVLKTGEIKKGPRPILVGRLPKKTPSHESRVSTCINVIPEKTL